jgi:hypothetical protein
MTAILKMIVEDLRDNGSGTTHTAECPWEPGLDANEYWAKMLSPMIEHLKYVHDFHKAE